MENQGGIFMVDNLKWTSIAKEEVEQMNFRLEASVFNIEAQRAKDDLKKIKYPIRPLCGTDGIATAYLRLRFKRVFVEKSDLPIYQPSQLSEIKPKPELFISHLTNTNIEALRVKKNQILLTCSGTVGKCTIVSQSLDGEIFSHDLLRISTINPVDTGYLYAYLKTLTGQLILTTNNYGAVIQHIEPEHLEKFPVPYPNEEIRSIISERIQKSFEDRDKSNQLLDEAEIHLTNALKLIPVEKLKPNYFNPSYKVQNFNVPLNHLNERFDGSYHNPYVDAIIDILLDNADKILPLGDSCLTKKIILPGRFKRHYVDDEQGAVFLGGKQIHELDPYNKKYLSVKLHGSRIENQLFLKENMIAITCSGTIGKVNLIPKHWENWTMSQHVLRAVPIDKDIAGYLFVWLNSDYGRILIERFIYGAVIDEIDENHLAKVPIPLIKDKIMMQTINDLALKANELRTEAYYLEQEAIKMVNELVIYS
jgi:type I restriction enzyme, S subunit